MMGPGELTVSSISQDALSDFSESSRDEIREMLGPDVYQERFRVDRSKLERLIQGENSAAEMFFQKIMENTNTYISWPHRLKVGAKSKKDPHVRIGGLPENVKSARERVLDVLDAKTDRVNMKLDVSYTDHSHIIGKGGNTIKRVMESTGCHIHFPDSNRNSNTDKSNQVSIAGTLEGVEKARYNIRRLMPLIFSFELPVTGSLQPMPDNNCPMVQRVSKMYNVEVMFRQRFKLHSTLVLVKGCEWEMSSVKQATLELIRYMCGEMHAAQVTVEMSLEISPQHHGVVLGHHSVNLRTIMQQTGTRILFPDAEDPNIATIKKSNIRISGNIDQVYLARQHLIGSLPLIVMFELPSGAGCDDHEERVMQLMQAHDVNIKMRQKPRSISLSVLIKGVERHAGNVYAACQKLLNLEGPLVKASIPDSYHIPNLSTSAVRDYRPRRGPQSCAAAAAAAAANANSMYGGFQQAQQQTSPEVPQSRNSPWMGGSTVFWSRHHPGGRMMQPQPQMLQPLPTHLPTMPHILVPQHSFQPFPSPDSAIHSASVSSLSSPSMSPRPSSSTPTESETYMDLATMLSRMTDRRAPGCERKTLERVASHLASPPDTKKLNAYRAMQRKPVATQTRIPTDQWSGSGLSLSTPEYTLRKMQQQSEEVKQEATGGELNWRSPTAPQGPDSTTICLGASNYLDSVPQRTLQTLHDNMGVPNDLPTLLIQHDLERYINLFAMHEIDLNTFLTLSEKELEDIGIDKFGPRRKIRTIITDLRTRQQQVQQPQHDSPTGTGSMHYEWH